MCNKQGECTGEIESETRVARRRPLHGRFKDAIFFIRTMQNGMAAKKMGRSELLPNEQQRDVENLKPAGAAE